jgi:XTP/dITP diphosphohydrolase
MDTLLFATRNPHKVTELRLALEGRFQILSLDEAGIPADIPEPHPTLEENAREKSTFIHRLTGGDCFSEDTGLEVHALGGEPGARSARYAGEPADDARNRMLLLERMRGAEDRRARFRTVISLIRDGREHLFTGTCEGRISTEPRGKHGFGYDPVFIPEGFDRTFAEMSAEEKNRLSHRRKATEALVEYLVRP